MSMELNREQKRAMQRMGAVTAEGTPARTTPTPKTAKPPAEESFSIGQYLREVRAELKKVAWPTRDEVVKYSIVVLITVVLLTAFVALLDFLFGNFSLWLFEQ